MIIGTKNAVEQLKQAVEENKNITLSEFINNKQNKLSEINNFLDSEFEFKSYATNQIKVQILSKTNCIGFMQNDILIINTEVEDKNKILFIRVNNKYFIGRVYENDNGLLLINNTNSKTIYLSKEELKQYDFETIGQVEQLIRSLENKFKGAVEYGK